MSADTLFDERDRLLSDVLLGKMSRDDAEAEACRLGFPPLQSKPDPAMFNPMSQQTWTLIMAVAWVVWRTSAAVRECWDDYRENCTVWEPHEWRVPSESGEPTLIKGWSLMPYQMMTLQRLRTVQAITNQRYANPRTPAVAWFSGLSEDAESPLSIDAALLLIWEQLGEGALSATALSESSGGRPIQIPSHEWPYLGLTMDGNLVITTDREEALYQESSRVEYHDVRFRRSDLCRLWPIAANESGRTSEREALGISAGKFSERRLEEWCIQKRDEALAKKLPAPTITSLIKDVAAEIGDVPRASVRAVWAKVRPVDWSKRGPRGPRKKDQEK